MFIPLTIAIFSGALSPSCLEGQHYISARLQQATWKLEDLPGESGELTGRLREILSDWHVDLPCFSFDFLPSASHFPDFNATAALCRLRVEEMEYTLNVLYCEEQPTVRYLFYSALLRAEARWLKLLLKEKISRLRSDIDARLLLCEVLEEVYGTGVLVDEASRRGLSAELCGQLKGALASLYLELTINFGHLLQSADYMGYRYLFNDARYFHPVRECEVLKYDILQAGNRVKRLVSMDLTERCEADAMRLYADLVALLAGIKLYSHTEACLWQGVVALENFLFILCSSRRSDKRIPYSQLVDEQWMRTRLNDLCNDQYAGHLHYNEGRGASEWAIRKLNEPCLGFLSPLVACEASLPRMLRSYLQSRQELYEQNYSRPFISISSGEKLSIPLSRPLAVQLPDMGEVHTLLAFLPKVPGTRGGYLMSSEHVQWLEDDFLFFLQSGQIPLAHKNRVKILKGYVEVLYGLFFHYQKHRGGDKKDYAIFLASMLDVDAQPENLVSNYKRYIEAYEAFVSKENLRLIS